MTRQHRPHVGGAMALALFVLLALAASDAAARNPIRNAFFDAYPQVEGTRLDDLPGMSKHCGVCHYDFAGGGARNPYGVAIEGTDQSPGAIFALGSIDSDGDGFTNETEILDPGALYDNTPTFPGLHAGNVNQTSNVNLADIQDYLTPYAGGDAEPPVVTVLSPNGGESLPSSVPMAITWTATDNSGIVIAVDIDASFDGGLTWKPVAVGIGNSGSLTWFPDNRPTLQALIRVSAVDATGNEGLDVSDAFFEIYSGAIALVPTTLRDFDHPGTQPFEGGSILPPTDCRSCHGDYNPAVEPAFNWRGSMMAQASIDPLFLAALTIANQDAAESGDLCLRCHMPAGWLHGRSTPTDGGQMLISDKHGVSCDLCHRMVDPIYEPGVSPEEDQAILAALGMAPTEFGNGMFVIDPTGMRRGPFPDADLGHAILYSPFHQQAAICGTCHDVSNPALQKDGNGNYVPGPLDQMSDDFASTFLMPVERTYSEWLNSEYNTIEGVYAPQFGGNKEFVATCQDCHMRDVTGKGCNLSGAPQREDLPLHDMTGGSVWLPTILDQVDPTVDTAALQAGADRATYMLENAATMIAEDLSGTLRVTVTNETGHKLPTGYPEGRRIWINVQFKDSDGVIVAEHGAYDAAEGILDGDSTKVYETLMGLDQAMADIADLEPGKSFHFVLNNEVLKDNRIPPRGFTNDAFAEFGGAPVQYSYADGQYWDETDFVVPANAEQAVVSLYYQSTSKEMIDFLLSENSTDTRGQEMYDLWVANDRCPPNLMAQVTLEVDAACAGDLNGDGYTDLADLGVLLAAYGVDDGGDLNGDGSTDLSDLGILLADYGCGS
jgi:hypothetical protein